MLRQLLFSASICLFGIAATAQTECSAATPITADGTYTVDEVSGEYSMVCSADAFDSNGGDIYGYWLAYTPASGGMVTFSSDLSENPGDTDTRLSVFVGSCDDLTCYWTADDVSGSNYMTTATFPVGAGVTYYIQWDSYWLADGFDFTVSLLEQDCVTPALLDVYQNPTTITSAAFTWQSATGMPDGYEIDLGDIGHTAGSGIAVSTETNGVGFTDLTPSGGYDFYIRSDCGDSQSGWEGPYGFFLATPLPYSDDFDQGYAFPYGTFTGENGFWYGTDDTLSESGDSFTYSNATSAYDIDAWLYSRALSLSANEQVTVDFYAISYGEEMNTGNFDVTFGTEPSPAGQTNIAESFTIQGDQGYLPFSATWTAPADGVYYFAVHHNTPAANVVDYLWYSLIFDSFSVSSTLGLTDSQIASIKAYPNPASDLLTVANPQGLTLSSFALTDLNGREILNGKMNTSSQITIPVSDLSAGIYLLQMNTEKGSYIQKVAIE